MPQRASVRPRICRLVALSSTTSTGTSRSSASDVRCPRAGGRARLLSEPIRPKPNLAVKWNWLPWPASLSTHSRPCIISTRRVDIVRPNPVPPYLRVSEPSACAKASKITFRFSGGMPIPVSRTTKCSNTLSLSPGSIPTFNTTSPLSVNLTALLSKLVTICRRRVGSPTTATGTSGWTSQTSSHPFWCACTAKALVPVPGFSGLFGLDEIGFSLVAPGDVPADAHEAGHLALGVAQRHLGAQEPHRVARRVSAWFFPIDQRLTRAHERLLILVIRAGEFFGIEIEVSPAQKLLVRGSAHQVRNREIGEEKTAFSILDVDQVRRMVDQRS